MTRFSLPTEVQVGDAAHLLSDIKGKRIFIVCDGFLADSDNMQTLRCALAANNTLELFTKVKPDPTAQDIGVGISALQAFAPDLLLAYGGGSAIDLAKAINYTLNHLGQGLLRFIAIPTTSGTGSEVTDATVISLPEQNKKIPLFDRSLLPERAILDPKQTMTVPPHVTVATGLDVLTHALEALVATHASHFSDALAEKAASLVFTHLATAQAEPKNEAARSGLLNASCLAGIAFNHAGLGLAHAMAHQLGATLHIPHGEANGLVLLPVIQFNRQSKHATSRYARLARVLGLATYMETDEQCVDRLIDAIRILYRHVGFDAESMMQRVDKPHSFEAMANQAMLDVTLTTNPIQPSISRIQAMLAAL